MLGWRTWFKISSPTSPERPHGGSSHLGLLGTERGNEIHHNTRGNDGSVHWIWSVAHRVEKTATTSVVLLRKHRHGAVYCPPDAIQFLAIVHHHHADPWFLLAAKATRDRENVDDSNVTWAALHQDCTASALDAARVAAQPQMTALHQVLFSLCTIVKFIRITGNSPFLSSRTIRIVSAPCKD